MRVRTVENTGSLACLQCRRGGARSAEVGRAAVVLALLALCLQGAGLRGDEQPVGGSAATEAGELQASQGLTLADCVRTAEARNRELARRRSALERAALGRTIATTEVFFPLLTAHYMTEDEGDAASGSLAVSYETFAGFQVGPFLDLDYDSTGDTSRTTTYGVRVSRPLLAFYEHIRRRLPVTAADTAILTTGNELDLARRRLRLSVASAFYGVQLAKARMAVRANRVRDSDDFLAVTRRRVQNGFSAPVDVVNATINLSQARADLLSEETRLQNALDNLKEVMGLELTDKLVLHTLDDTGEPEPDYDLQADGKRVLQYHETLVNRRLDIDLAALEITVERDNLRPQIDVALSAQQTSNDDEFFANGDAKDNRLWLELTYAGALDFNRADRARFKQLEREQQERLSQLKDQEIGLLKGLRATAREMAQLESRIGLAQTRFTAEQDKLKATLARYERGNVDNLEVTRAKQTVDNAEIELLESRINLLLSMERYEAITPEGLRP